MTPKVVLTPFAIILTAWLFFTGITYSLLVLAMLFKNVFRRTIVAVAVMAALTLWEERMGGLFNYLVPKLVLWTDPEVVFYKMLLIIVTAVLISIVGSYAVRRKEYWGNQKICR